MIMPTVDRHGGHDDQEQRGYVHGRNTISAPTPRMFTGWHTSTHDGYRHAVTAAGFTEGDGAASSRPSAG